MAKITQTFTNSDEVIVCEFDGTHEWLEIKPAIENMGFRPITPQEFGIIVQVKKIETEPAMQRPPVKASFCPYHKLGDKKWEDHRDGGYYCGHKNPDGTWCGFKVDETGKVVKPPKMLSDYVDF